MLDIFKEFGAGFHDRNDGIHHDELHRDGFLHDHYLLYEREGSQKPGGRCRGAMVATVGGNHRQRGDHKDDPVRFFSFQL